MSISVEWDEAKSCGVWVGSAEAAEQSFRPDDSVSGPLVLVLGGLSGGCFAIEGDKGALLELADKIFEAVENA